MAFTGDAAVYKLWVTNCTALVRGFDCASSEVICFHQTSSPNLFGEQAGLPDTSGKRAPNAYLLVVLLGSERGRREAPL